MCIFRTEIENPAKKLPQSTAKTPALQVFGTNRSNEATFKNLCDLKITIKSLL